MGLAIVILTLLLGLTFLLWSPIFGCKLVAASLRVAAQHNHSSAIQCPDCGTTRLYDPPVALRFLTCVQVFLTPWVTLVALALFFSRHCLNVQIHLSNPIAMLLAVYLLALLGRGLAFRGYWKARAHPQEQCGCNLYGRCY